MAINVPGDDEEAAAAATTRPRTSPAWETFKYNAPAAGGAPTATCGECGKTLCASSKNGTSHLNRHIKSKWCQKQRAAKLMMLQQLTAPSAADAEPSPSPTTGDQPDPSNSPAVAVVGDVDEEFYFVDGINVPDLYDKLADEGLVNIAQSTDVAIVPQAARSSVAWFRKAKERKKDESKKRRSASDDESGLDFNVMKKRIT